MRSPWQVCNKLTTSRLWWSYGETGLLDFGHTGGSSRILQCLVSGGLHNFRWWSHTWHSLIISLFITIDQDIWLTVN